MIQSTNILGHARREAPQQVEELIEVRVVEYDPRMHQLVCTSESWGEPTERVVDPFMSQALMIDAGQSLLCSRLKGMTFLMEATARPICGAYLPKVFRPATFN